MKKVREIFPLGVRGQKGKGVREYLRDPRKRWMKMFGKVMMARRCERTKSTKALAKMRNI